jgi:5-methyltetrahydropteroyltriglutamate--homocysteine methyltransferase
MVLSNNLGFPRIGANREFKFATEKYWKGELSESDFLSQLAALRASNWQLQKANGIGLIPSNDYTQYDHVLDTACLFGAVPERYNSLFNGKVTLELYYSMARGNTKANLTAMEMTKWFDTNYHYIVPEFVPGQSFKLSWDKPYTEYKEAKALGINSKPVLLGPVSFLSLGKSKDADFNRFDLLEPLLKVYAEVLNGLSELGAEWIQIDEPCLVLDLSPEQKEAYKKFQSLLKQNLSSSFKPKILLATYFEGIENNLDLVLPDAIWSALHIDLTRNQEQLEAVLAKLPAGKALSIGLVDGRNIWKNDLTQSVEVAKKAIAKLGSERVMVAPSCSLLHSPIDLSNETKLNPEVKNWMAFAVQKLQEVKTITEVLSGNPSAEAQTYLQQNKAACDARRGSKLVHSEEIKKRTAGVTQKDIQRLSAFKERKQKQQKALHLPLFPTTTIGSFPQTAEVRRARAGLKKGEISATEYDTFIRKAIEESIRLQEEIEMDVLVHGEFERNDMVEYFGEYLTGFTTTQNGWVQSYGTRCVKPPVIYGDVSRVSPMTVEYTQFAQSLTAKPVKGMLTGPVTILQWSFVRDDQPRSETAKQIALAIIDEVVDLEKAGIKVIQIDEPAFREGLPLRNSDKEAYLKWATDVFRLSSSNVQDETQIHTHMCYSEFNDIISNIADMDADVITIETSRSQMELLEAFEKFDYPNQIGPGVYDIHSPRVPNKEEMIKLLEKAGRVLPKDNIWVNPDCGLKTRAWEEVKHSLINMIQAAIELRKQVISPVA